MPAEKAPVRKRARSRPVAVEAATTKRVTTTIYGKENEKVEREVEEFSVEPAYVRINAGRTKNLGNYESLRVDVSITVPCYRETINDTFDALGDEVESMLDYEVSRYLNEEG